MKVKIRPIFLSTLFKSMSHEMEDLEGKMQFQAQRILNRYHLKCKDVLEILEEVSKTLSFEPNVLSLHVPIFVAGSLNGEFDDLLSIFDIGGPLPYANYLFLGNYTGLSTTNLSTLLLLFTYKILYKDHFFLIRGSKEDQITFHQKAPISSCYTSPELTLVEEICKSYSSEEAQKIIEKLSQAFISLPIAAVINQMYFCVNYSPSFNQIGKFYDIDALRRIPRKVPFNESPIINGLVSNEFIKKQTNAINHFLRNNKMSFIFSTFNEREPVSNNGLFQLLPQMSIIFSAPNAKNMDNQRFMRNGCIIEIDENKILRYIQMKNIPKSQFLSLSNEKIYT
ncbi:protein phosphatase-1 [Tritrichomonas foetus]|uniref:protein-serine/threonine phosphatase n=1 Tax=Tritrichomonas foetus TaxID=1144522 RepID=A0A1J4JWH4_9EUKA|nr:protein phosphatase-1 [Tritrichomonas foetus]|eukprot:OHT01884.1 protein phosphatase-1 [Tritrichomonas foetus]